MHFFIPNDSDLTNSLESFVYLYSLRKEWYQEHWLLDVSGSKSIDDSVGYLQNLRLDLDDDLFLLIYSTKDKQFSEVNIWEYYEIHSSLARKVIFLGDWNSAYGLNITNIDKWTRRTNLEVCTTHTTTSSLVYGLFKIYLYVCICVLRLLPTQSVFTSSSTALVQAFHIYW